MDEDGLERAPAPEDGETLRAKYYDYCSARVADVLLGMTPDQIFVVAEEAAKARGLEGPVSYDRMVGLATEHISRQLGLPSFTSWLEAYTSDPASIEAKLLGLWESSALPKAAGSHEE